MIALRLAAEWVRAGRRVTILCGAARGPLRASVPPGVAVETLDPEITRGLWSRLRMRRPLRDAIGRIRPDILFLPGNFHAILADAARGVTQRPHVVAKISNPLAPGAGSPLRWLLDRAFRWVARDVDWFVAMSAGLARDVRRVVGTDRVSVIHDPNLIRRPGVEPPPPRRGPPRELHLLAAGRLVQQKDFALAIRIVAQLARARAVDLTIVGDGPERRGLAALARRLGIADRVHLPGHVPSIGPALGRADMLLVTSRYEGGPAVAVEALERGVPVVATDCSYFLHDILAEPDRGCIIATRDPAEFARRLLAWADRADRHPPPPLTAAEVPGTPLAARQYLQLFDSLCARFGDAPCANDPAPRPGHIAAG